MICLRQASRTDNNELKSANRYKPPYQPTIRPKLTASDKTFVEVDATERKEDDCCVSRSQSASLGPRLATDYENCVKCKSMKKIRNVSCHIYQIT